MRVTGTLDRAPLADQSGAPERRAAHRGSRRACSCSARAPRSRSASPWCSLSAATWDSPFLTAGTDGAHPLLATYGVIIATLFGAIGLPHILVRFYTNPDGEAARRTTLIVVLLLSTFYLFPAVLAVLTRLRAPELYLSKDPDSVVLALPSLLLPGLPGELLGGAGRGRRVRRVPVHLLRPAGQRRRRAVA